MQVRLDILGNPGDAEHLLLAPKVKLLHLKDELLRLEMEAVEDVRPARQLSQCLASPCNSQPRTARASPSHTWHVYFAEARPQCCS